MGFQSEINDQPAPGEAGDFYGVNPRASILGGPGMYSAPAGGLVVGRVAWVNPDTGEVSQSFVEAAQLGFLHRENNAVITDFLGEATYVVFEGLPITLFDQGDFWGSFADGATPGQRVWANPGTGALIAGGATAPALDSYTASAGFGGTTQQGAAFSIAVTGNVATVSLLTAGGYVDAGTVVFSATIPAGQALGARLTGSAGGIGTFTFVHADFVAEVATGRNNVLTVASVTQGALEVGSVVDSAGTDATVTAFGTGTGGAGTYTVSGAAQRVASGAVTATSTVMDVTAVTTGPILAGDGVSAPPAAAGTRVVSQLTGSAGAVGTYRLDSLNYWASTAVTDAAVATPWLVNSLAAAGELAKISTWG